MFDLEPSWDAEDFIPILCYIDNQCHILDMHLRQAKVNFSEAERDRVITRFRFMHARLERILARMM